MTSAPSLLSRRQTSALLADPLRLQIVHQLYRQARTVRTIAQALHLSEEVVQSHLFLLEYIGVVESALVKGSEAYRIVPGDVSELCWVLYREWRRQAPAVLTVSTAG